MTFPETIVRDVPDCASHTISTLIVEDDFLILDIMTSILESWGCEVLGVGSAAEAINVIPTLPALDLIVTDIKLPGRMNGVELVDAVRSQNTTIDPCALFMSGHEPRELTAQGVTTEDMAVLGKPFHTEDLRKALVEALAHRNMALPI